MDAAWPPIHEGAAPVDDHMTVEVGRRIVFPEGKVTVKPEECLADGEVELAPDGLAAGWKIQQENAAPGPVVKVQHLAHRITDGIRLPGNSRGIDNRISVVHHCVPPGLESKPVDDVRVPVLRQGLQLSGPRFGNAIRIFARNAFVPCGADATVAHVTPFALLESHARPVRTSPAFRYAARHIRAARRRAR